MTTTIATIQTIVAEHYGISASAMVSARRSRDIVDPRMMAMYLSKEMTAHSYPVIGRMFGGRDHTTVHHAVKTIEARIASGASEMDDVRILKEKISDAPPARSELAERLSGSEINEIAELLHACIKREMKAPRPDAQSVSETAAARQAARIANRGDGTTAALVVRSNITNPDHPFCKATAELAVAVVEMQEAKFGENEILTSQRMEKAAIALTKEFHKIRHLIERK